MRLMRPSWAGRPPCPTTPKPGALRVPPQGQPSNASPAAHGRPSSSSCSASGGRPGGSGVRLSFDVLHVTARNADNQIVYVGGVA
ncbi:hypothetical protein ABZ345_38035 [Lentzea sp. NPDC005914]|uniref:hypothetical protein n=1 Tax=Lentzea sp. NPDC005914 TaxID=3154572 RepID=UPI00340E736A